MDSDHEVGAALDGALSYDALEPADQTVVRREWDRRIAERIALLTQRSEWRFEAGEPGPDDNTT